MSHRLLVVLALAACRSQAPQGLDDGGTDDAGAPDAPIDPRIDARPDPTADAAPDAFTGPPADPFASLTTMPGLCSPDQWCWMAPTPHGNTYDHVFATAPDNLWLIGGKGTALQWDGFAWHDRTPPPPRYELAFSISGRGPDDMWLAAGPTLQHWDGSTWTIRDQGVTFGNIWVAPNGDMWCTIVGGNGFAYAPLGAPVQRIGLGAYSGNVWGLSAENFWVTAYSSIVHYLSGQFSIAYTGPDIIGMIGGAALDDMWFGGSGVLIHYAGGMFTRMPTGLPGSAFMTFVEAKATNDVTFWGSYGSGQNWLLHWDGATLTTTPIGATIGGVNDAKIIGGRYWLVGSNGAVATMTGTTPVSVIDPYAFDLRPQWGSSKDDMYWTRSEAGVGQIRHWDGAQWTTIPVNANMLTGVHTASGNELFAAGSEKTPALTETIPNLFHFDGATWIKSQPEPPLPDASARFFTRLWAFGPGDAIAIGTQGLAYRYAGGAWTALATPTTEDLLGIWGSDADHAFITGRTGVYEWNRASPGTLTADPTFQPGAGDQLGPIHGADGIAWAGITNGIDVWRHTAAGWTRVVAGNVSDAIWATSATDVVIASNHQALVVRWNGTAWLPEDNNSWSAVGQYLYRPPGGPLYAVENNLAIMHP